MRPSSLLLAGLLPLLARPVAAAEPCPTWRERQTMHCMRGYLRVDPAAMTIDLEDSKPYADPGRRLGYATAFSAGMFRSFGGFAFALGGRFAYDFHRRSYDWGFVARDHYIHAGAELRIGSASRRMFGYGLFRGGFTRWDTDNYARTSIALSHDIGGHYAFGGGIWGRLGRRFLLGGEVVLHTVRLEYTSPPSAFMIALTLGAWL